MSRARIRSSVIAGIATVVIGALAIAPMAPPPEPHAAPTVSRDVRLTGAGIIRNQFQYCSLICPSVLQGAITVPIATVQTPVTFLDSLASTGSPLKAIGAAAASVTGSGEARAKGSRPSELQGRPPRQPSPRDSGLADSGIGNNPLTLSAIALSPVRRSCPLVSESPTESTGLSNDNSAVCPTPGSGGRFVDGRGPILHRLLQRQRDAEGEEENYEQRST